MALSNDLISQFVKITNDKPEEKQETTVYGTTVVVGDKTYVRFDGSDLLTPVDTTSVVKDNERVTVMVKNHTATITGNVSSPSASSSDVKEIGNKISEFEIVIADKVSVSELDAANGRIDNLVTENVLVKERLTATEADISDLNAENVNITGRLTANEASIESLETTKLDASVADITYATIKDLEATNLDVNNLEATYGDFEVLTTNKFSALDATISSLDAEKLDAATANITYATITNLNAAIADIAGLSADVADIDTLIFGSASGSTIQTSFANAVIAQLGNAQIKSAMIEDLSASKITSGDIITNNVRVMSNDGSLLISDETIQISDDTRVRVQIGKDSSGDYSINIWDANGNLMFSEGGITDSAIKDAIIRDDMVSDTANISAHKLNITSLFEAINGSTQTINSSKIYLDAEKQTLDVVFTSVSSDMDDLNNAVTSHGTQISTIQGQIKSKVWQQDIDDATGDLSTQYSALNQTVNSLSSTVASHTTSINNKADKSTVTTVSDKVTALETSLSGFQSTVSSTYATITDLSSLEDEMDAAKSRISQAETEIDQHAASIALKASQSDLDTVVSDLSTNYYTKTETAAQIRVATNSITSSVSSTYATKASAVAKTQRYYLLQDSTATAPSKPTTYPPTGAWVTTEPSVEQGESQSLYYVDCNIYVSGSFTYGDVNLSSSLEAASIAQESADNAQSMATDATSRITTAESIIQQLSDQISTLITDGNGASLMTQTSTGWTFSMASIQEAVNTAQNGLSDLQNDIGDTNHTVEILQQAVDDLSQTAEYVRVQVYEDEPCIELGESDSDFKLLITNTRIMFMDGSNIPTYIDTEGVNTENIIINKELRHTWIKEAQVKGHYIWAVRSNGNYGLQWKGVTS